MIFQDKSYTNGSYSYISEKFEKEVSTWAMGGHYLLKSEEIKYRSAINIVRNSVVQKTSRVYF